jgi:cell division protein FtsA
MLNRLQEKCFYGLDIGAHKIKACAVTLNEEGEPEIAGIYECATQGFGEKSVTDLHALSESIHQALEKLVEKTGVKAKTLRLGINGDLIFVRPTSAVIPLADKGNKTITQKDIRKVNQHARLLGVKMDEDIIHELPLGYVVDDTSAAINPLGLYGRTLGIEALLVGANGNTLKNITKAVHLAGYEIEEISFSTYAAAARVLTVEQRVQGVALVDIGSNVSSILIYRDDVLKYIDVIKTGGSDFTQHIADETSLSYDLAEEIKKSYALAIASSQHYEEEILVKKENAYIPIKREVICRAIQPCVTSIVASLHHSLKISGQLPNLNHGLVLIGGGSLLAGLIECIEQETRLTVALGKMTEFSKKQIGNAALFSSVVGLACLGLRRSLPKDAEEGKEEDPWSKRFLHKVVELYNEYF